MNQDQHNNVHMRRGQSGQAALEYALIAMLVGLALVVALLATGPVLGNIFSSVIIGAIGDEQNGRTEPEGGPTSFWLTVTWVATQTPQETPFPTNIANPRPTDVPDGFEEDTPIPPEPTETKPPTPTVEPSPTPPDLEFDLAFNDEAALQDWYRLSGSNYLGQNSWEGLFWQDRRNETTYNPFESPGNVRFVRAYDANENNFVTPLTELSGMTNQWFSARFSRPITVIGTEDRRLGFRVSNPSGGVRIYLKTEENTVDLPCRTYEPPINERDRLSPDFPCLILDAWVNVPDDEYTAVFTLPGGTDDTLENAANYTIVVEYYHRTGSPNLQVELFSPQTNRDDAPTGTDPVDCKWRQYTGADGPRSNTREFSWSYAVGLEDMPNNSECHLELRGSVLMNGSAEGEPSQNNEDTYALVPPPVLTFWHIWDLPTGTNVRLEVAPYNRALQDDGNDATDPISDLDGKWSTVWDSGTAGIDGTSNYEWTQERVELTSFTTDDVFTYRFVIRSSGSTGRKVWFVDDIFIGNENLPDLLDNNPAPEDTFGICVGTGTDPETDKTNCARDGFWSLDDMAQAEDFRTTGRWNLTANAGAVSGMAWEDDPGNSYSLEDGGDRVYYIEFDKRIDVTDTYNSATGTYVTSFTDPDGDGGPPMLTFWQTYNLGDDASIEVQYYDDGDPGDPNDDQWRLLRTLAQTGASPTSGISRQDKHFVEVPLHLRQQPGTDVFDTAEDGWTEWYENPLRLRFALTVSPDATSAPNAAGWTIDDILIERLGLVDFAPYPLKDSAGDDIDGETKTIAESRNLWNRTGSWDIASARTYGGGDFAFTDSPNGDYLAGSDTMLELRAVIDLNSDTPQNPASQTCTDAESITGSCLPAAERQDPASQPTLSFWWNRALANDHTFYVEIYPNNGAGPAQKIWEYVYDADDAVQPAWERAEIALWPFLPDNGDALDDDVKIVFNLSTSADSTATADGIWLDDIRIQDNDDNPMFLLGAGTNGGNGQLYYDDVDQRQLLPTELFNNSNALRWWERFYLGGTWTALDTTPNFDPSTGVLALHESPGLSVNPFDAENSFRYEANTFQTIEMIRHIDLSNIQTLRGSGDPVGYDTEGDDASPMLVWWHRYDKGPKTRLKVQIAAKLETEPPANTLTYGDDELYGWTPWQNVYITPPGAYNQNAREYQWVRERVNLQYAAIYNDNGDPTGDIENFVGQTIRVRFVLDANETVSEDDVRDGWFIDNIQFTSFKPRVYTVPFSDNGDNQANWVMEGDWGLDVEHARGGASTPSLAGDAGWSVTYLNCTRRPTPYTGEPATGNNNNGCGTSEYETMLTFDGYRQTYDNAPGDLANPNDQWLVRDFVSDLNFEFNYDDDYGGRPPGAPNDYDWDDRFAAEFRRTVTVTEPYRYQFYVRADDGVRVGVTPFPSTTEVQRFIATQFDVNAQVGTQQFEDVPDNPGTFIAYNNVINAWRNQAPTVYQGAVTLVPNSDNSPRDYELTIHYFESGGGAYAAFGLSGVNSSFSDSPMTVPSADKADRIPVNYYSDTSMTLDGLLDLSGTNRPILNFYTLHELSNVNSTFYVQVSDDGGFTWNEDDAGLDDDFSLSDGTRIDTYFTTSWSNDNKSWQERTYNLSDWRNKMISLRFRLDVNASQNAVQNAADNINNEYNGANVASILVFDVEPPLSIPQIVSQSELNVVVERNEEAFLELIASGQAPLRYEWYRGPTLPTDPNVVPSDAVLVATNVTSFRPDTSKTGTFNYWVRVSNSLSDSNASVDPALSSPWLVRVVNCNPQDVGDCGTYRLNFNGDDIATNDGSLPGWAGTRDSADSNTFKPNNGNGYSRRNDTDITVPTTSHDSVFVQAAIDDNVDGNELYQRYFQDDVPLTWNLPIDNGSYIVRLYMADNESTDDPDKRNNRRFSAALEGETARLNVADAGLIERLDGDGLLDGGVGDSVMELISRSAQFANNGFTGPVGETGAIIELSPINVTDGVLNLTLTPTEGNVIAISGLETIPVSLDDIIITEQPANRNIAAGFGTTLTVRSTGPVNQITWYAGLPPADNAAPTGGQILVTNFNDGLLVQESTLTLAKVLESGHYFARVENTDTGDAVNSDAAFIDVCEFDPAVLGSCDRWYINSGLKTGSFQSADGLVWHADEAFRSGFDDGDRETDTEWQTFTPGPGLDLVHTNSGSGGSIFANLIEEGGNFGYRIPGVANGTYTVKLYFHDPYDRSDREFDISFEGFRYVNRYNLFEEAGSLDTLQVETYTVTVLDGELNMELQRRSAGSILSGMEFYPQTSNVEILTNNLLTNAGFESGTFDPWTGSNNTASIATDDSLEGTYSAKLTRFGSAPSFVEQTFTGLKSNTRYTLSVYIKTANLSARASLYARGYGGPDLPVSRADTLVFAEDWTQVQLEFVTGPTSNSVTFGVERLDGDGTDVVWADNFSLVETP